MIRKAIIPAAGLGTRFLPATKAMPKEMLPIVDKPTIQYIIEEAVESGIEDIIIVTGKGKRAIEDHFDSSFELEHNLLEKGKFELLDEVRKASRMADIHYIRQKEPLGLGHAVWCARKFIGNEPFAVLLGDDIVVSQKPCIRQMIDIFNEHNKVVVGVQPVEAEEVSRYGIVKPDEIKGRLINVSRLVEKPAPEKSPSNLAIMGRYILTPDIFDVLSSHRVGAGGEVQLTDAISELCGYNGVLAYSFEGIRYDVGEKMGFIRTVVEFALSREDLRHDVIKFLRELDLTNDLLK